MYDTRAIRGGLRQRGIRVGLPRNPQRGKEIRRGVLLSFDPKVGRFEAVWNGSLAG